MREHVLAGALTLCLGLAGTALADTRPVSRLPLLPDPPTDPLIRQMTAERQARGGDLINLEEATWHAPKIAHATGALANALRFDAVTPRVLRELVIMRVAGLVGSPYELNQHRPFILACGVLPAKVAAIPSWRESALFDPRERAVLAYVDEVAHGGEVDDATYARFQSFFTPQEIVELTVLTTYYYGTGLLTRALEIQPETDGRHTAPGKC